MDDSSKVTLTQWDSSVTWSTRDAHAWKHTCARIHMEITNYISHTHTLTCGPAARSLLTWRTLARLINPADSHQRFLQPGLPGFITDDQSADSDGLHASTRTLKCSSFDTPAFFVFFHILLRYCSDRLHGKSKVKINISSNVASAL